MISPKPYNCGHPRGGDNDFWFNNGGGLSSRCRECRRRDQRERINARRGALRLVIRLLDEGTLSEGQVAAATGMDRAGIRAMVDAHRAASALEAA